MLKKIVSSMLIIIILVLWMPIQTFEKVFASNEVTTSWEFDYTGNVQNFVVPYKAVYKIELYGAQGGNIDSTQGGNGSYVVGTITMNKNEKLSIYIGGQNGYNGGGSGNTYQAVGGGATDIRLGEDTKENRIIVAAGGGGSYKKVVYHQHTGSAQKVSGQSGCYYNSYTEGTPCGYAHDGKYGGGNCPNCGSALVYYGADENHEAYWACHGTIGRRMEQ